jgi:hypothetical protein
MRRNHQGKCATDFINEVLSLTTINKEELFTNGVLDMTKFICSLKNKGIVDDEQYSLIKQFVAELKEKEQVF